MSATETRIPDRQQFLEAGERACLIYAACDPATLMEALGADLDTFAVLGQDLYEDARQTFGRAPNREPIAITHALLIGVLMGRELFNP